MGKLANMMSMEKRCDTRKFHMIIYTEYYGCFKNTFFITDIEEEISDSTQAQIWNTDGD